MPIIVIVQGVHSRVQCRLADKLAQVCQGGSQVPVDHAEPWQHGAPPSPPPSPQSVQERQLQPEPQPLTFWHVCPALLGHCSCASDASDAHEQ